MSDVELLRKAAALMRERAEAATPGSWKVYDHDKYVAGGDGSGDLVLDGSLLPSAPWEAVRDDVQHIASWDPTVAFVVADLLDAHAEASEYLERNGFGPATHERHLLAVVRAYLRSEP